MNKKLKLFVWKDVFCDYTCGMAFAIGETKEQAIDAIVNVSDYEKDELIRSKCEEYPIDKPIGFAVWGGG